MKKFLRLRVMLQSLGLAGLAVMLFLVFTRPEEGTVEYHMTKYYSLTKGPYSEPKTIVDWVKPDTFAWLVQGRPTDQECFNRIKKHQDALIALGHFEKRVVNWPSETGIRWKDSALTNTAILEAPDTIRRYSIQQELGATSEYIIVGRPGDVEEFERVLESVLQNRE